MTVTLNIPDAVNIDDNQVAMLVASKFYEQGKLSLDQAAQLAGLSKRTFAELLSHYNVSVFNHSVADLSSDIANAYNNYLRY